MTIAARTPVAIAFATVSALAASPGAWASSVKILQDDREVHGGYFLLDDTIPIDERGDGVTKAHAGLGGTFDERADFHSERYDIDAFGSQFSKASIGHGTFQLDARMESGLYTPPDPADDGFDLYNTSGASRLRMTLDFEADFHYEISVTATGVFNRPLREGEPVGPTDSLQHLFAFGLNPDAGVDVYYGDYSYTLSGILPAGTYSIDARAFIDQRIVDRTNTRNSLDFTISTRAVGSTVIPTPAAAGLGMALLATATMRRRR